MSVNIHRVRACSHTVYLVTDKSVARDLSETLTECADEIEALRAQLAAYKQDAKRYRWLRRPNTVGVGTVNIWQPSIGRYDFFTGIDLDEAIDAAIARREGE